MLAPRRLAPLLLAVLATAALAVEPATRRLAKSSDAGDRRDAAKALAEEGTPAAVKLLRTLIADEHPWVRDQASSYCDKLRDDDAIDALLPLLKTRDEVVRRSAVVALGRTKSAVAGQALRKIATSDKSAAVRRDAVAWLETPPVTEDTLPTLTRAAQDADPLVRATTLITFYHLDKTAEGAEHAVALLGDEDEGVRCAALWALSLMDRNRVSEHIGRFREDDGWRARMQAIETATLVRDTRCVEVLIELLTYPHRRISTEAHQALRRVTGLQYGQEPDLWRAWLDQTRDGWKRPEKLKPPTASSDSGDTTVRYHGIEIASDGIVFAIDASGSMTEYMGGDYDGWTRWGIALARLRSTVEELPDGVRVNVLLFNDRVTALYDDAKPLSASVRKDVDTFLKRGGPSGNTNVFDTLQTALEMEDVDTLFLLGDGEPNRGTFTLGKRIRPYFWASNRRRKLKVNTISIGADESGRELLRALADLNGGEFVGY